MVGCLLAEVIIFVASSFLMKFLLSGSKIIWLGESGVATSELVSGLISFVVVDSVAPSGSFSSGVMVTRVSGLGSFVSSDAWAVVSLAESVVWPMDSGSTAGGMGFCIGVLNDQSETSCL